MRFLILITLFLYSTIAVSTEYIGADGPTFETTEYDFEFKTGIVLPSKEEMIEKRIDKTKLYKGDLPTKFSWADHPNGITPIRNQGNCGSCVYFSLTATLSDILKLKGLGEHDLSEQSFMSCSKGGWQCNGAWLKMAYFLAEKGIAMESDWPYQAKTLSCKSGLEWKFKADDWGYVVDADGIPDTELIKRAMMTYGPLSVVVSVSGGFGSYRSGIFNESNSGPLNHAVGIYGWNDEVEPAHWIMRNSWGNWGENGTMRIAYKSKRIGYAATYIDYDGEPFNPDPTPTPTPEPGPGPGPEPKPIAWYYLVLIGMAIGAAVMYFVKKK